MLGIQSSRIQPLIKTSTGGKRRGSHTFTRIRPTNNLSTIRSDDDIDSTSYLDNQNENWKNRFFPEESNKFHTNDQKNKKCILTAQYLRLLTDSGLPIGKEVKGEELNTIELDKAKGSWLTIDGVHYKVDSAENEGEGKKFTLKDIRYKTLSEKAKTLLEDQLSDISFDKKNNKINTSKG